MPELEFQITGVEAMSKGMTPLLHFKLRVSTQPPETTVQALILQAQVQIQCPRRSYTPPEKERLVELFGAPQDWARTLRTRLWTHTNTTLSAFAGSAETVLPVPCTYDLNIASARYLYALEGGKVPLLFLFSGSVFYAGAEGRLQVERISWEKEAEFRMPLTTWRTLMNAHYPNSAWVYVHRDVFDQLAGFKRRNGLATWDATIESLLGAQPGSFEGKFRGTAAVPGLTEVPS